MAKFCRKCGAPLKENTKFCSSCGAPVAVSESRPSFQEPVEDNYAKTVGVRSGNYDDEPEFEEKKGHSKWVVILIVILGVIALAAAAIFGIILLKGGEEDEGPAPNSANVVEKDDDTKKDTDGDTQGKEQTEQNQNVTEETPAATEEPVQATPEPTPEPTPEETPEATAEPELIINEEYAAYQWYTYYISYLDAINHGGDTSYLIGASAERKESFKINYEKYNKGYTFENISFDVDKTDMKLRDLGNGKIEATMHAYVVNVCTTISSGAISDNKVTLQGVVLIDKKTGKFTLTEQKSDNNYTFGKHEMIHCVLG